MKFLFLAVLLAAFSGCVFFSSDAPAESRSVQSDSLLVEAVADNLDIPWAMDFLPDGRLIFTERPGTVKILGQGVIHEISVAHLGESGLQGIAVHPGFEENKFVYLYYTYREDNPLYNRVSRFTLENNSLLGETVLLEKIPGNVFHDGGRIRFGPDGMLYVSTGDAGIAKNSQDLNSLAGKILRMGDDGGIPAGNPYDNYVYSFGHRNVQGFDWHPKTGAMIATEHGPSKHDEINVVEKGKNYGWPGKLCKQGGENSEFVESVVCFDEWTLAPSGASFYSGDKLPFRNSFIYSGLRGEQIRILEFDNGVAASDEKLIDGFGRIRDIVQGKDGWLYFATNNTDGRGTPKEGDDKIYRVKIK